VDEFLSTILRSADDPAIAAKLIKVIDALKSGSDLDAAARSAGLDRATGERLLETIKDYLKRQAGDKPARQRVRRRPKGSLQLIAISDGASRGNPGEAACAVIITDSAGEEVLQRAQRLGVTTNNVAEYHGVILALELAKTLNASELLLKLDSELVVKQLKGEYKVKHASLKPLFERARELASGLTQFDVRHVPREKTKAVDKLANAELDRKS
jgi:ribonuclease HI